MELRLLRIKKLRYLLTDWVCEYNCKDRIGLMTIDIEYNENIAETVKYISLIANSLSLLGSTCITLMFMLNKELRNFAFYLIFNLAVCDSLYAISNLILLDTNSITSNDPRCLI